MRVTGPCQSVLVRVSPCLSVLAFHAMRYAECVDYLNRLGNVVPVAKHDLDNIRTLLDALGNPQRRYPSVLVAGTNGKGSVAAFLSSILAASGLQTGLYTSPHLISIDERIAINGLNIAPEAFADCVSRTAQAIEKLHLACHPTFFETITSAAFLHFGEAKVDIALVEAGMGGRTDSTNILEPILSVITPISMDHQQYLGQTIEEIAYHKAGIIHRKGKAISARQRPEVGEILEQEATRQGAVLRYADEAGAHVTSCAEGRYRFSFHGLSFEPSLYGRHQVGNAVLAVSAAGLLEKMGYPITPVELVEGVNRAFLPARIHKISESPAVFVDGAHNDEALAKLAEFVVQNTQKPRALVFGMMSDKRLSSTSIDRLAGCFDKIYLTRPQSARAATCNQLRSYFSTGTWIENPLDALKLAKADVETVLVTGSLYLVGEILALQ